MSHYSRANSVIREEKEMEAYASCSESMRSRQPERGCFQRPRDNRRGFGNPLPTLPPPRLTYKNWLDHKEFFAERLPTFDLRLADDQCYTWQWLATTMDFFNETRLLECPKREDLSDYKEILQSVLKRLERIRDGDFPVFAATVKTTAKRKSTRRRTKESEAVSSRQTAYGSQKQAKEEMFCRQPVADARLGDDRYARRHWPREKPAEECREDEKDFESDALSADDSNAVIRGSDGRKVASLERQEIMRVAIESGQYSDDCKQVSSEENSEENDSIEAEEFTDESEDDSSEESSEVLRAVDASDDDLHEFRCLSVDELSIFVEKNKWLFTAEARKRNDYLYRRWQLWEAEHVFYWVRHLLAKVLGAKNELLEFYEQVAAYQILTKAISGAVVGSLLNSAEAKDVLRLFGIDDSKFDANQILRFRTEVAALRETKGPMKKGIGPREVEYKYVQKPEEGASTH